MVQKRDSQNQSMVVIRQVLLWFTFLTIEYLNTLRFKQIDQKLLSNSQNSILDTSHNKKASKNIHATQNFITYNFLFSQHQVQEGIYEILINMIINRMITTTKTATSSFHSTQRVTYLRQKWSAISET